jgi:single-strand DNA-binding protein
MAYERITLIGNLGGDPITHTTKEGQQVANFSLAVNRKKHGAKVTTWYRIACWNGSAELASKYLKRGSRVLVEGDGLHATAYLDQAGKPQASLELTADRLVFLDSAPENGASGSDADDLPL